MKLNREGLKGVAFTLWVMSLGGGAATIGWLAPQGGHLWIVPAVYVFINLVVGGYMVFSR